MRRILLHITGYCLLVLMLIKMLGMPLTSLSFIINQDYIASKLCENRYKPEMHCNGQCILMKKLSKANESNETKDTKAEVKSIGIDYVDELPDIDLSLPINHTNLFYSFRQEKIHSSYISSIFHPPGALA